MLSTVRDCNLVGVEVGDGGKSICYAVAFKASHFLHSL